MSQIDVPAELSRTHSRGASGQDKEADGIALFARCHPSVDNSGTGLAGSLLQSGAKAQAERVSFRPSQDEADLEAKNYLNTFWSITAVSATSLGSD